MEIPSGSPRRSRGVAGLLTGSAALTLALFADGFAFFAWDRATVVWLSVVALAGALAGHWLLRSMPASLLAGLAGAVAVLHLLGVAEASF